MLVIGRTGLLKISAPVRAQLPSLQLHNSILGVIYCKDYNTTPSTYVLSNGSQAYFNTSRKSVSDQHGKENLCFVKGLLIVPSKETASKIVRTGRMRSFESSHRSLSNVIVVLFSSPPPLPPSPLAPSTIFIYILQGHKLVLVRGGGGGGFVIILIPNSLQLQ